MTRRILLVLVLTCCDEAPKVTPVPDVSAPPPPPPPPREGCTRSGVLEPIETDPACVMHTQIGDDAIRAAMKNITITAGFEVPEISAGNMATLNVTMRNTGKGEVLVLFEARTRLPGPRTDWSRVVGIPEPKVTSEQPKLFFPVTTLDGWERDVDALPTVAGSTPVPAPPTVLGVHLRKGAKLTQALSWWALRIPAPAPEVRDDAGHRFFPKTAAVHLLPGEYTVAVELPLYGLTREERRYTTRIKVTKPLPLDGGPPRR